MSIGSVEIVRMRLDEITPATYNPRVELKPGDPDFEKLKASIQEFGLVDPLVINKTTGNLVGGHQRLAVMRHLKYEEADVSIVELDPAREKALNLALNKVQGDWDLRKLQDVVDSIDAD